MFFSKKNKNEKLRTKINENPNINFSLGEVFPDQNLAQIIAKQIGVRPKDKITLDKLNTIQSINAANSNISNLEGIEFQIIILQNYRIIHKIVLNYIRTRIH